MSDKMIASELQGHQKDASTEQHGDGISHAFILEQMQRGFAEVNARIDRLMIVLIVGMFGIITSIIGVAVASFLR